MLLTYLRAYPWGENIRCPGSGPQFVGSTVTLMISWVQAHVVCTSGRQLSLDQAGWAHWSHQNPTAMAGRADDNNRRFLHQPAEGKGVGDTEA